METDDDEDLEFEDDGPGEVKGSFEGEEAQRQGRGGTVGGGTRRGPEILKGVQKEQGKEQSRGVTVGGGTRRGPEILKGDQKERRKAEERSDEWKEVKSRKQKRKDKQAKREQGAVIGCFQETRAPKSKKILSQGSCAASQLLLGAMEG